METSLEKHCLTRSEHKRSSLGKRCVRERGVRATSYQVQKEANLLALGAFFTATRLS